MGLLSIFVTYNIKCLNAMLIKLHQSPLLGYIYAKRDFLNNWMLF